MIPLAVVKIKLLNIIGHINELDAVTTALGKTRAFQPDNAVYSDNSNMAAFTPLNDENPYSAAIASLTDSLKLAGLENALSKIRYPKESTLPVSDWKGYVQKFSGRIQDFQQQKQDLEKKIQFCDTEIKKIGHFDGIGLNLDELRKCKFVKIRFGSLPEDSFKKLGQYDSNPFAAFFPGKFENAKYWGMYCAPNEQIDEVDRLFSGLSFEPVTLDELSGTVESAIEAFALQKQQALEKLEAVHTELLNFWGTEKRTFNALFAWLKTKYTYYDIRRYAARHGESFILTGWIPASKAKAITATLENFETVKYTCDDASDPQVLSHSPPVQLRNKKLWRPFEFFVDVYGLPSYTELDPTLFVAFTYFIFFGTMFADLGQGLCIVLIGWYLWKKKKSKLGYVMIPCGISSAIVGTAFGSVFGFEHALDPLFINVFGLSQKPISVMDQPTSVVYFAIGLGICMVLLAILTNIFACLKRRQYANGLFGPNGVAGFLFYCSVLAGFGGKLLFGWNIVTPAYVICLMILPLIAMMFRDVLGGYMEGRPDWRPESWGEAIMQNFFEVFEFVLSYLTNTISFIRVGAFVLVHAGMMMVIFELAETSGRVGYVITLIIGNAFVIALEGLLSGVQSLRLEFYELFSRFYDGSGRPYTPVIVGQEA